MTKLGDKIKEDIKCAEARHEKYEEKKFAKELKHQMKHEK